MHTSPRILLNRKSGYHGHEFVTRKITPNLAKIKLGKISKFSLSDIEPEKDWGCARDYVYAIWLMFQHNIPDDFVIATGETDSVWEFLEAAIEFAGLIGTIADYVDLSPSLVKPSEVALLIGNAVKAREKLGWEPRIQFHELVEKMMLDNLTLEARRMSS